MGYYNRTIIEIEYHACTESEYPVCTVQTCRVLFYVRQSYICKGPKKRLMMSIYVNAVQDFLRTFQKMSNFLAERERGCRGLEKGK